MACKRLDAWRTACRLTGGRRTAVNARVQRFVFFCPPPPRLRRSIGGDLQARQLLKRPLQPAHPARQVLVRPARLRAAERVREIDERNPDNASVACFRVRIKHEQHARAQDSNRRARLYRKTQAPQLRQRRPCPSRCGAEEAAEGGGHGRGVQRATLRSRRPPERPALVCAPLPSLQAGKTEAEEGRQSLAVLRSALCRVRCAAERLFACGEADLEQAASGAASREMPG